MIHKFKIVLGFLLFLYLFKLIHERYFLIEGMCMDGENELPGISETECSNGGFTWTPPPDPVDALLESTQASESESESESESSTSIPEPVVSIASPPKVESDLEREERIKNEEDKKRAGKNMVYAILCSSYCSSYCCCCLLCLSMFLPLFKR